VGSTGKKKGRPFKIRKEREETSKSTVKSESLKDETKKDEASVNKPLVIESESKQT